MRVAVAPGPDGGGSLRPLADDGTPLGPPEHVPDLIAAIAARERADRPRWVWAASARLYPPLLAAGVRVSRCHDLELVEGILLAYEGRYGEPRALPAAWARLTGAPVPPDQADAPPEAQQSLFSDAPRPSAVQQEPAMVVEVHAEQLRRMAASEHADRLPLLAAAESAGGLVAAEMRRAGIPWRAEVHDGLLTEWLGPRPGPGLRPKKLQVLADQITAAFGKPVNPDSPAQLVKAFAAAGFSMTSTRAHVLRDIDHPAVPVLLEYKELARLWTAHGWTWLDTWVQDARFRPEYIVGGVVSGRWATNGGGALQIPKVLRRAVVADPGWKLVVADAAQLEPRVLAALAGDRAFATAAAQGDLYTALADAFGGARDKAKIALLSAMYGGGTGDAVQLLGVLRQRFPQAYGYVEAAARDGEAGRLVRSRLGRTCPPPSQGWRDLVSGERGASALRSRGRFTRNFVVQATAAEWALALLATVRTGLAGGAAELVFFQHDEVMVHAPEAEAEHVAAVIRDAGVTAGRLLFGETRVVFPIEAAIVDCYADAK
jgi:DNA polymerase I-like protein with 3'-5' exonuclease and polymerase domains